jgi:hypothetical protein
MGITQYFHRATPASSTTSPRTTAASSLFWPLLISNFVLSALSIANLGLISSMVGWLLDQKHNVHTFRIDWPGNAFDLNVEPANLWVDQGHTSNGVAGYGFFLGLFGMFVAWRTRRSTVGTYTLNFSSHRSDFITATPQDCYCPLDSPVPGCSFHSQRSHLRLRCDKSDHGSVHPPAHCCQQ